MMNVTDGKVNGEVNDNGVGWEKANQLMVQS